MRGRILKGIGGFYYAADDEGAVHTLHAQNKIRREKMKPLVGDIVEMSPGSGGDDGWIQSIYPRANALVRPPVANIDVIVIVAAAAAPDPDLAMIDKLLVNAQIAGIRARLVINKSDLSGETARDIANQYASAGVAPTIVCARTGEGVDELRESLRGCVHALTGQSGAGKSSLVNALYGFECETGEISAKIERGKNTTRRCELIPLPGGGMVLDTPGFSLLDTPLMEPEALAGHYPEFSKYDGQCFFKPCMHASEPKCAVRDAVNAGDINAERHARYVVLLEETRDRWRDRYD